jgi:hypothetical protein
MFCRTISALVISIGLTAVNAALARAGEAVHPVEKSTASDDPSVPARVVRAIKRAEVCHYLAGGLGGDNSNRDKEVNEALKRNKCAGANAELRRLKIKYKNQAQVLARIKAAE